MLHAHLYVKKHKKLNECCIDAMDFEDNMDLSNDSSHEGEPSGQQESNRDLAPTSTTTNLTSEQIADIVMRRMGQLYHPPTPEIATNMPTERWCELCRWNYTHTTRECHLVVRLLQERALANSLQQHRASTTNNHREFVPPPIEVQDEPQARAPVHDTTSSTYACTNRAMSGGELGNFQPYLSREEPS